MIVPADRWLERVLAVECPACHALGGSRCATNWVDGTAHQVFCASRIQAAAAGFTRATVAAWIIDRTEQYSASSGYRAFVDELLDGILGGAVEAASEHGELDDDPAKLRPGRTTPEPR